jgi:hypothetical protein
MIDRRNFFKLSPVLVGVAPFLASSIGCGNMQTVAAATATASSSSDIRTQLTVYYPASTPNSSVTQGFKLPGLTSTMVMSHSIASLTGNESAGLFVNLTYDGDGNALAVVGFNAQCPNQNVIIVLNVLAQ